MKFIIDIILLISAILGLVSIAVRSIESVYQLSQTPNLNTFQKCKQVITNFFSIETYASK